MNITYSHHMPGTPFRIETSPIKNAPGTWNSTKVSIYRNNDYNLKANVYRAGFLIGEYIRNYSSFGYETFYPFQIDEQWYALYSAEYTATRIMKLHNDRIEDWCGEDESSTGFCPTEFYVPRVIKSEHSVGDSPYDSYYADCDYTDEEYREEIESKDFVSIDYCDFGFLSGCVWGDDTSWKLRYIDLSKVPDKILSITEKFGYWELPEGRLKDHIRMDGWEPTHNYIRLTKTEYVKLK